MADVRWKDKPQLVALAGTELIAATSVDGGAKVGGGTIAPNADLPISTGQILAAAAAAADDAIADAIAGIGSTGGASIGVQFLADTASTTDADPGAGNLRWNNGTQASATVVFLNDASVDGASLTGFWSALDVGGFLYAQHATDQDTWQIWEVTGIADVSGYVKLTVTNLVNGGSFADDDPILVTLEQGQGAGGAVSSVNGATGAVVVTIAGISTTQTLASASTVTPVATDDVVDVTALVANLTVNDPSGTAASGQGFLLLIKSAAAQTLTWGAGYLGMDAALATTTIAGKQMAFPVVRAHTLGKWLVFKPSVQP